MGKTLVRVVSAEHVRGYQLRLRFNDDTEKIVDFSRWMGGDVFAPLRSKREFKRFFLYGGTVSWPNGANIAPETLFSTESVSPGRRSVRKSRVA